jgi:hypothetical protein
MARRALDNDEFLDALDDASLTVYQFASRVGGIWRVRRVFRHGVEITKSIRDRWLTALDLDQEDVPESTDVDTIFPELA